MVSGLKALHAKVIVIDRKVALQEILSDIDKNTEYLNFIIL